MHTGLPPSRAATHELIDGMLGPSGGSCFLQSELFMFFFAPRAVISSLLQTS